MKNTSDSLFSENENFILTENVNCFRITKSNFASMQRTHKEGNKHVLDVSLDTYKSRLSSIKEAEGQVGRLFDKNNQTASYSTTVNSTKLTNLKSRQQYPKTRLQTKRYFISSLKPSNSFPLTKKPQAEQVSRYLKPKNEISNKDTNPKPDFEEDRSHMRRPESNNKQKIVLPDESEEAYAKFKTEVRTLLERKLKSIKQEKLETTEESPISGGINKLTKVIQQSSYTTPTNSKPLNNNKLTKRRETYHQITRNSLEKTIRAGNNSEEQDIKGYQSSMLKHNGDLHLSRKQFIVKQNNNDLTTVQQLEDKTKGQTDSRSNIGIVSRENGILKEGSTHLDQSAINTPYHTLYNQEHYLSHVYQCWPTNYFSNFDPTSYYNFYVQNWMTLMYQTYQNTVDRVVNSELNNYSFFLPYTGVAGYNWPTIRKPLQKSDPQEKNNYPVYVKPPVLGNEETEKLRNAFIKYVKGLKYKLYLKSVRKRKQVIRRERNHKSRTISKLAKRKETALPADLTEEATTSDPTHQRLDDTSKFSITTDRTVNQPVPHLETDSWIVPSADDSRRPDLPGTCGNPETTRDVLKPETDLYGIIKPEVQPGGRASKEKEPKDYKYRTEQTNLQTLPIFSCKLGTNKDASKFYSQFKNLYKSIGNMGLECLLTAENGYIYLPNKKYRQPSKLEATSSILATQPLSMVSLLDPEKARAAANLPPDPGPYEDPPKLPKFLKPYWRDKEMPKVLRGVLGRTIKLTIWMKEIAWAMVENCKGQRYIDPRRFRNQFRRYVTLEKRARLTKKLTENPPPPQTKTPEIGAGEFPRGGEYMVPDVLD